MEDLKKVRVVNVTGFAPGEEVDMPRNRAITYARNGQATPVGWSPDDEEKAKTGEDAKQERPRATPRNRMLDTSKTGDEE